MFTIVASSMTVNCPITVGSHQSPLANWDAAAI